MYVGINERVCVQVVITVLKDKVSLCEWRLTINVHKKSERLESLEAIEKEKFRRLEKMSCWEPVVGSPGYFEAPLSALNEELGMR